jgi:predicted HD phosphohydrolase
MTVDMTVDELLALLASCEDFYDSLGDDGDPIPILPHSLQCAARLSDVAPDDDELIVAGLVHDIGHRLQPGHPVEHGMVAADAVRGLLGERVAALVELHVPAKRYLVTVDDSYRAELSTGSTASLARQGGVLDGTERAELERRPELADALTLRRADEAAKDPDAVVPDLDHWRPIVDRVASSVLASTRADMRTD